MLLAAFVKTIDHPAPGFALAVVDLTEIKHRPLDHTTAGAALTLDNAPVTVLLAVLPPPSESQIHERRFYSARGRESAVEPITDPTGPALAPRSAGRFPFELRPSAGVRLLSQA